MPNLILARCHALGAVVLVAAGLVACGSPATEADPPARPVIRPAKAAAVARSAVARRSKPWRRLRVGVGKALGNVRRHLDRADPVIDAVGVDDGLR